MSYLNLWSNHLAAEISKTDIISNSSADELFNQQFIHSDVNPRIARKILDALASLDGMDFDPELNEDAKPSIVNVLGFMKMDVMKYSYWKVLCMDGT